MFVKQWVKKATGLHKLTKMEGLPGRRVHFSVGEIEANLENQESTLKWTCASFVDFTENDML